jgi:hypothetical protein
MSISVIRVLAVFLAQATQTGEANPKQIFHQIEFRILHCQKTHHC